MGQILHINMDDARFDPEKAFGDPVNVIDNIAMTRGQKIAALDRWSHQVQHRIAASNEGMPENGYLDADISLLDRIRGVSELLRSRAQPADHSLLEPA